MEADTELVEVSLRQAQRTERAEEK